MIIKIENSPVKNKRFRVTLDNNTKYDFGLYNGNTFIDHHDDKLKKAYRARHLGNEIEFKLIKNLVPSPALFSYYILWNKDTIKDSIEHLNELWKKKYSK